jgi:ubiquitin C-terminal hydrolase
MIKSNKIEAIPMENNGNQCYINSIMQVLRFSCLAKIFYLTLPNMLPKYKLTRGLGETSSFLTDFSIVMLLNSENLEKVKKARERFIRYFFGKQQLDGHVEALILNHDLQYGEQEDAKQFFDHLIEIIDDQYFKFTRKEKRISELYTMKMNQYTTCQFGHCYAKKNIPENCLMLPVCNYDEEKELTRCIERYFKFQFCDDLSYCMGCDKMVCRRTQHKIQELPQILVIQLLRFGTNIYNQLIKFPTIVKFDQELNLSAYLDQGVSSKNYKLKGIVEHHGFSLANGHYTSTVKVDDSWVLFNDEEITNIPSIKEHIERYSPSITPYILFYERHENKQIEPPVITLGDGTSKICSNLHFYFLNIFINNICMFFSFIKFNL